jgi:methionyl-tRNA formyltransferase
MRVLFIGTGDIGVPVLRRLIESGEHQLVGVVTQPDKPVGREQRIEPPPVKLAAAGSNLPILQPKRIKDAVEEIRTLKPDVIVVMAYGQILPRTILEIPRIACLNLHASLLPRHRGAAPIQAAIVAGDRETGITVMYMDEGLDTGDMLLQKSIPIASDETGGSLHDRLAESAPTALSDALVQLEGGTAPRTPQNSSAATYAPKLDREAGRIDWSEPAALIERKIRAFNPWPGAFALLSGDAGRERKLKIFRAHLARKEAGEPLLGPARDCPLALDEVQLEGKRRMTATEFLRGYHAPVQFA